MVAAPFGQWTVRGVAKIGKHALFLARLNKIGLQIEEKRN